jgi:CDGSH-type Zn-finger protein/uncharacterized Fe-S cluster protein YjdI
MSDDLDPRNALPERLHAYTGKAIDVTYSKSRCIHVRACMRGLPRVFDPGSRPWVICDNSTADKVAAVVEQCPSGALQYLRKDGGPAEVPDEENALLVSRNGPLFIRGRLQLVSRDGTVSEETRLTLCRCGASTHKPYCDNSHLDARFSDPASSLPTGELLADDTDTSGPLRIEPQQDGPLQFSGNLRVLDAAGVAAGCSREATFCRCGHSASKPFCDGSHVTARFSTA